MTQPLITVIIPAYNNEATLGVAIESIIAQTYPHLDIIVVDDFSTDRTRAVAERYAAQDPRIRIIEGAEDPNRFNAALNRNINAGWSARNAGLASARGEYITFQDGDDASLLNRIEVQFALLKKYGATHLTLNCIPFDESLVGKRLNIDEYCRSEEIEIWNPDQLYRLSQKTKGVLLKVIPTLCASIPFAIKRKRVINKLFFGSLASYPGSGNYPLFKREVIDTVQFRPLNKRVWPSFMGRGADRDFNFQVAETFKNSYFISLPLYLWRVPGKQTSQQDLLAPYLE